MRYILNKIKLIFITERTFKMHFTYKTQGVCSSVINFDLSDDGVISNVVYTGGCNGNLKAVGKLVEGMKAEKLVELLSGNTCGPRPTSCADQLARAVSEACHSMNIDI